MKARRLRDEFVASIRRSTPRVAPSRLTFGEVAEEWLAMQADRDGAGRGGCRSGGTACVRDGRSPKRRVSGWSEP
jgi:hypothetical protein